VSLEVNILEIAVKQRPEISEAISELILIGVVRASGEIA